MALFAEGSGHTRGLCEGCCERAYLAKWYHGTTGRVFSDICCLKLVVHVWAVWMVTTRGGCRGQRSGRQHLAGTGPCCAQCHSHVASYPGPGEKAICSTVFQCCAASAWYARSLSLNLSVVHMHVCGSVSPTLEFTKDDALLL